MIEFEKKIVVSETEENFILVCIFKNNVNDEYTIELK